MNSDLLRLKRLLFRTTRGNASVLNHSKGGIETFDKKTLDKSVFIVFFQDGTKMRDKIETIVQNFSKNTFRLPKREYNSKLTKLEDRIEQTRQLIVLTVAGIQKYLDNSNID